MSPPLDRIIVVGTSCAGKTTFARKLSAALGQEFVELDALHWSPNWQPKPEQQFRALAAEAAARTRWVVEGNYRGVREILWPRATTVVWLNYSFATVMFRAFRRTVRRAFSRERLWHGNQESFRRSFFSRDSILMWVVTTFHRRQREYHELRSSETHAHLSWVEFQRPSEAERYLRFVQNAG